MKRKEENLISSRLVVLESGLKSIFAGLGLGLGLGKICKQVHFQFSLCTFAVLCLGRMTFCQPVSYTLFWSVTLYSSWLYCTDCGLQCGTFFISEWMTTYSHLHCIVCFCYVAIKDSDLKLVHLDSTGTWLLLVWSLELKRKGQQFCITKLPIRVNCLD